MKICKIIILLIFLITFFSCKHKYQKEEASQSFPYSENEMSVYIDPGLLLEYAIFDTSKIEFVKNLICDTINSCENIIFSKCSTNIKESTYYYYYMLEEISCPIEYYGVLRLNADNLDSISSYTHDYKCAANDLEQIIEKICDYYEITPQRLLEYDEVNSCYKLQIDFIVEFKSMKCEDNFIEKALAADHLVNSIFEEYINKEFTNKNISVEPYIEFRMQE